MEVFILFRAEKYEGSSMIAVCATLDRAKAEAVKEHTRVSAGWSHSKTLGEWYIEPEDPFKRTVANIDDTGSYVIESMQVLS